MRRRRGLLSVALAVAAGVVVAAMPAAAQDDSAAGEQRVLRIGWAQDPRTLNPFVGLDEENYNVWAINWDLLVNLDPSDLSPAPGIARSWKLSEDRKTVTFELDPEAKWSDDEPITSEDVKFSLDVLGSEGDLFSSYTTDITSVRTPDEDTVVVTTRKPDARLIGGIFIYIIPGHIWGEVPVEELTKTYKPELPLVGSGPFVVTEFERGRIIRMEPNPNFRGEQPVLDEIQFIKYGTQDAVERALQLGEIDVITEVEATTFNALGEEANIETLKSESPAYTQLAFNLCPAELCPEAERNPAVLDRTVRQAIAYSIDRPRINEIAARGTSFVANGILPAYYKDFYTEPEQTYPHDPELANQMLDEAGWVMGEDGVRTKDDESLEFDLYVRSESPYNIQAAKLVAEQAAEIGVRFNVEVVSVDKLTEITTQDDADGNEAPAFDTFIWGWGGDPYDPSFLLSLLLTSQIGNLSDAFYSNPEYDRLYDRQTEIFDVAERREVIRQMIAITQRDLPYIVLTDDPELQAYRADTLGELDPTCPAETGDAICAQSGYEPLLSLAPVVGGGNDEGGGQSPGLAVVAAIVFGAGGWLLGSRARRRREREPLELAE